MAETLITAGENASRVEQYQLIIPQLKALVEGESDLIANLANIMAVLKETFGFHWVGVYFVKAEELVLGPFQGPLACTRIGYGKGVCGAAWKEGRIMLVPDVEEFPGHIACSSLSKSEIVIPAIVDDRVRLVLDIDSDKLNDFSEIDVQHLKQIISIIESLLKESIR